MLRRLTAAVMAVALVSPVAILVMPVPAQAADTGTVTLVHGVRGLVADIYLDGAVALQVFQPERTAGPLTLPAGSHAVDVRAAGSAATSTPLRSSTAASIASRRSAER